MVDEEPGGGTLRSSQKRGGRTAFDQHPGVQMPDGVGRNESFPPVRDHEGGPAVCSEDPIYDPNGSRVEIRISLVEEQQPWGPEQSASKRDARAFAEG